MSQTWRRVVAGCIAALASTARTSHAQNESQLAKASQNPIANLTSIPLQFNFNSGGGLGSTTYLLLNVQPVMPLTLNKKWLLISRTIVPYTNIPLPTGIRVNGLADIQQQSYFTLKKPSKIVWGLGPIFSVPTATNDVVRTGQWALGPTGVALITSGRWVVGALANNLWRIGGVRHGLAINQFTTQPFINFNIPQGWAIVTAPLITANWSASDDERWTVPIGIGVSKISRIGQQPVNVGAQYYHNTMHPSEAGSDQFRFQFTLLYPIAQR
jgi:hypothetical protein